MDCNQNPPSFRLQMLPISRKRLRGRLWLWHFCTFCSRPGQILSNDGTKHCRRKFWGCISNDQAMVSCGGNWIRICERFRKSKFDMAHAAGLLTAFSFAQAESPDMLKERHTKPWSCMILPYLIRILFDVFILPPPGFAADLLSLLSLLTSEKCDNPPWSSTAASKAFNTPLFGYASDRLGRRKARKVAVSNQHKHTLTHCA